MCLAIPGKITDITDSDPVTRRGIVDFEGLTKEVNLAFVPEAAPGDYVLVHVGFAIASIDPQEAARIFATLRELGALDELGEEYPPP